MPDPDNNDGAFASSGPGPFTPDQGTRPVLTPAQAGQAYQHTVPDAGPGQVGQFSRVVVAGGVTAKGVVLTGPGGIGGTLTLDGTGGLVFTNGQGVATTLVAGPFTPTA